jgi:predicted nucleic acid-binding protein
LPKLVVADAGPLIAFARLHQLDLLAQLFSAVLVTDEVLKECTYRSDFAESATVTNAVSRLVLQRCVTPPSHFNLALHVDTREASAIAAAVELGCAVLMDDKAGRRMAKNFGVATIGTVGVLVLAKQKKLLAVVKPCLDQLTQSGYFLGDSLIASALLAAGE